MDEHTCETCKYSSLTWDQEPCESCTPANSGWEQKEDSEDGDTPD